MLIVSGPRVQVLQGSSVDGEPKAHASTVAPALN